MPSHMPFDPPSPVAIARELCGMTSALRSDVDNFERCVLVVAHRHLSEDPPNVDEARAELAAGMAHGFRQLFGEQERPESWLVAAAARLLAGP